MIFILITVILAVVGFALSIAAHICYKHEIGPKAWRWDSDHSFVWGIIGGTGLFFALFCIIPSAIENSSTTYRITYNETVAQLNATRTRLLEADPASVERLEVASYNEQVSEFRSEILTAQEYLKNPWLNTFTCYVYNEFDANAVSYI